MKKYILYAFTLFVLAAVSTACVYDEAEPRPRPTQRGYSMFGYADMNVRSSAQMLTLTAAFNEYFIQTTDEARLQVHDTYFYSWRIYEDAGGWWVLIYGSMRYHITIGNDIPLGEPGAEWTVVRHDAVLGGYKDTALAVITTEGDMLKCEITPGDHVAADWTVEVLDPVKMQFSISGSGTYGSADSGMELRYTIAEPLIWDMSSYWAVQGLLSIEAYFPANMTTETTEAQYSTGGYVKITYSGIIENWQNPYY